MLKLQICYLPLRRFFFFSHIKVCSASAVIFFLFHLGALHFSLAGTGHAASLAELFSCQNFLLQIWGQKMTIITQESIANCAHPPIIMATFLSPVGNWAGSLKQAVTFCLTFAQHNHREVEERTLLEGVGWRDGSLKQTGSTSNHHHRAVPTTIQRAKKTQHEALWFMDSLTTIIFHHFQSHPYKNDHIKAHCFSFLSAKKSLKWWSFTSGAQGSYNAFQTPTEQNFRR